MSELLPKDIQVEIFLKLPVNSILACKCVCKSWRQLLCNPEFVKNHLNRSIQTNQRKVMVSSYHPFMLYSSDYASISKSSSQSFSWNGSVAIDFPFHNYRGFGRFEILGSCNGLICLLVSDARRKYENNVICIWNPSTREHKKVPVSGSELYSAIYSPYATRYGFDYDCVRDDYKLVRINNNKICSRSEIHVYRLRSDKWYRTGTRQTRRRYSFPYERKSDGLLSNGALHLLGTIRVTFTEVIVSFNLSNDKMVDMPLPAVPPHPEAKQYKNLGVLEDCLCLVFVVPRVSTDVWVMKDYRLRDSWTKQFTFIQNADSIIDFSFWKPILVFKNGDILADTIWQSVVCDPEEGSIRKVCISSLDGTTIMDSASYVESLVSLNSGNYVLKKNKKKRKRTTHYE
ncbi:F-box protein CPR1-like [Papaver somniferum]|uniref:F-box protein CPR1-like n=1 Tax=Papaver somniferum TaxID=3469 RepID=UPI000E7036CA|nr:F-box protein CPR1-like [Papaver somniferum]